MSDPAHSSDRPRRRLAHHRAPRAASRAIRGCGSRCDPATDARVAASEALRSRGIVGELSSRRGRQARRRPVLEYGVTTGFGEFKDKPIAPDDLEQLQRNLLLCHSVGVGENCRRRRSGELLPSRRRARRARHAAQRVSQGPLRRPRELVDVVAGDAQPRRSFRSCRCAARSARAAISARSRTSSSSLLGERAVSTSSATPDDCRRRQPRAAPRPASFSDDLGWRSQPTFKEGLALVNGANFSAAMLALGGPRRASASPTPPTARCGAHARGDVRLHARASTRRSTRRAATPGRSRARRDIRDADRAAASSSSAPARCRTSTRCAARRRCTAPRATPSPTRATSPSARSTPPPTTRSSSPTTASRSICEFRANWPEGYRGDQRLAYSAGNFHGQPLALAADFLAIAARRAGEHLRAAHADAARRRTTTAACPPNLTTRPGVNSGLMIIAVHAPPASSPRTKCSPIPPRSTRSPPPRTPRTTCRCPRTPRARCAPSLRTRSPCWRSSCWSPRRRSSGAWRWRSIPPGRAPRLDRLGAGRSRGRAFEERTRPERRQEIAEPLGEGTRRLYLQVREAAPTMLRDRMLEGDIRAVLGLVQG